MDVRFTAGGTPVVIHDASVDRTTNGTGLVADMSLAELRALDAGSWFSAKYVGTKVPTLYEVLRDGIAYRARYLVELKVRPTSDQLAAVLDRLDRLGMRTRVVVSSGHPEALADVRAAAPDLRTAIIDDPIAREPSSVLQYGTAYVVSHRSVTPDRALSWRTSGIAVYSWTVDSRGGWLRMADEVVAGTITNRPVRYLAWARSFCG
jgi:glycerophosphoryl diester phosphodiesterase